MKRIMDWLGKGGATRDTVAAEAAPGIDLCMVGEFLLHFPIGTRVHYFPEYQRSIKLDSIILGCDIDGQRIYSDHAVHVDNMGGTPSITLRTPDGEQRIERVERFCFLVPYKSRSEIDYPVAGGSDNAFTEKNVNDFKRGNTITLFNKGANGKVPYLDTNVARVRELRDGVYANRMVALLDPDPKSFQFLEQRQYHRVYTRIPATLSAELEGEGFPCSVQDFSERYLRIVVDGSQPWVEGVREGVKVVLTVHVPGRSEPFLLRGAVHRRGEAYLVVELAAIYKQKRFQNMDMIDELDLKTTLLHHPETQQSLAEEAARK